jgi:mono/diheme cytochrome c family protein
MRIPLAISAVVLVVGIAGRASAQAAADTKELYSANCKKCHGVLGTPPKAMKEKFPKIATFDGAFLAKHSEDSIVTILTRGKNEDMKSFKDKLSPDQMHAVAQYVRELAARKSSGTE